MLFGKNTYKPSLVQEMVCCVLGAKPLYEPVISDIPLKIKCLHLRKYTSVCTNDETWVTAL